ncbi:MAG: DUF3450 domain-containing protein [Prevotellaceae bacterium]|jgi:hypothetical protein|nr:DUF3450 domain-containing protein [Prevotellaceae bacterium]
MVNIGENMKQVNFLKQRVQELATGKLLFYEIWAFMPETSAEYQLWTSGNSRDNANIVSLFSEQIDNLLTNDRLAKVKVVLKSNKKNFGESEIVLRSAYQPSYQNYMPVMPQPKASAEPQNSENQQHNNYQNTPIELFKGLGEIENSAFGGLGAVINVRDKLIANEFEKIRQEEKSQQLISEITQLKLEIQQKDFEIKVLKNQQDKLEDKIEELEDHLEEYEKINPKRDMVSGLLGQVLEGVAVGVLKKSPKISALMGFDDETPAQPQTAAPQQYQQPPVQMQPVEIQEVEQNNNNE